MKATKCEIDETKRRISEKTARIKRLTAQWGNTTGVRAAELYDAIRVEKNKIWELEGRLVEQLPMPRWP